MSKPALNFLRPVHVLLLSLFACAILSGIAGTTSIQAAFSSSPRIIPLDDVTIGGNNTGLHVVVVNTTVDSVVAEDPLPTTTSGASAIQRVQRLVDLAQGSDLGGEYGTIPSERVLTVVISTFKQPTCLRRLLSYTRTCKVVKEIRINWFENSSSIPDDTESWVSPIDPLRHSGSVPLAPIVFDDLENRLSHRFKPRDWQSDAIFSMDVDVMYSCKALEWAYQVWVMSENSEMTAVGFHPRMLFDQDGYYEWELSHKPPYTHNTIFITKGGIVHRNLLEIYFENKYEAYRKEVDEKITGEDMLMSFVMALNGIRMLPLCADYTPITLESPLKSQEAIQSNNTLVDKRLLTMTCGLSCHEGVKSLGKRTSKRRPGFLQNLFNTLGNPFNNKTMEGKEMLLWQNKTFRDTEFDPSRPCLQPGKSSRARRQPPNEENTRKCREYCHSATAKFGSGLCPDGVHRFGPSYHI